jgi:hypothetical protein
MKDVDPENILDLDNLSPQVNETKPATAETSRPMPPDAASEDLARAKLKRLADFIDDSLSHPNSEVAMLGLTNASLMRMAMMMSDQIEQFFQDDNFDVSQLDSLMQAMEMMLKLTRQVEGFSKMRLYISESQSALKEKTRSRKYLQ